MNKELKAVVALVVLVAIILWLVPGPRAVLADGITLPIDWGDIGQQLVTAGVIDQGKLDQLYSARGGVPATMSSLMTQKVNDRPMMTKENSGVWLNLLWAFGLGQASPILDHGAMMDPRYNSGDGPPAGPDGTVGAGGFASTGGWTLARGEAMDHYSRHHFVNLTSEQEKLVEKTAKQIHRPCCPNGTDFPDCNHGMAMLGLLELMAAKGQSETQMLATAKQVNALWFPQLNEASTPPGCAV